MRNSILLALIVVTIYGCMSDGDWYASQPSSLEVYGSCSYPGRFPVRVDTGNTICPQDMTNPLVVFGAHPDDETLAMAGPMVDAKAQGRTVIVELMTNGEASRRCGDYAHVCSSCGQCRIDEMRGSLSAMGIDGYVASDFGDGSLTRGEVESRADFWVNLQTNGQISGLSLRGTAGYEETTRQHSDHEAVRQGLLDAAYADTKWYAVYLHDDLQRGDPNKLDNNGHPWTREPINNCTTVSAGLNAYKNAVSRVGYDGAQGLFECKLCDCSGNTSCTCPGWTGQSGWAPPEEYVLYGSASPGSDTCGEASCVNVTGSPFISHFTGRYCDGAESYYRPYFSGTYNPNPDGIIHTWDGQGVAGTVLRTLTNYSYKTSDGVCHENAWSSGNTLSNFVYIYRCGEATCGRVTGTPFISHYSGENCTGDEYYYTPYFSGTYDPNPDGIIHTWDGVGLAGTQLRTVTNYSYRDSSGACIDAWPWGNELPNFVKIYR
jgi:LmbE family N-acetylglucosaminyl deacetylase